MIGSFRVTLRLSQGLMSEYGHYLVRRSAAISQSRALRFPQAMKIVAPGESGFTARRSKPVAQPNNRKGFLVLREQDVEPTADLVQTVREKIDDAIDVVENLVDEKLAAVPSVIRAPLALAANGAFSTIRGILGIPDDIGGDED